MCTRASPRLASPRRRWGNNGGRKWRGNRGPTASINFVTAHDGFTLHDLVAYNEKHNEANGENNRDGEQHNNSWNCGTEGPTPNFNVQVRGVCGCGWLRVFGCRCGRASLCWGQESAEAVGVRRGGARERVCCLCGWELRKASRGGPSQWGSTRLPPGQEGCTPAAQHTLRG